MAKKTFYKRPVKNAKLKEVQEQFENYKERNNVKVSEILKLRETNERLCEALEFYADEKNHIAPIFDEHGQYNGSKVDKDSGEIARQALGGEANE